MFNNRLLFFLFLPFLIGISSCKDNRIPGFDMATNLKLDNYVSVLDSDCLMMIYNLEINDNVVSFNLHIATSYSEQLIYGETWYYIDNAYINFDGELPTSKDIFYEKNSLTEVDVGVKLTYDSTINTAGKFTIFIESNTYGVIVYGGEIRQ